MEGVKATNWIEVFDILEKKLYKPVSEITKNKFAEYITGNSCKKLFESL
jgi:hypothetical protein